ncbi:MAG: hypothetical protein KME54_14575 [Tolypothrix brevis GSE-NOS-MK-07-07A]|nr:hypothetical protein [Tolypothrix brevis GSE-NOS-MK-07-07A]
MWKFFYHWCSAYFVSDRTTMSYTYALLQIKSDRLSPHTKAIALLPTKKRSH